MPAVGMYAAIHLATVSVLTGGGARDPPRPTREVQTEGPRSRHGGADGGAEDKAEAGGALSTPLGSAASSRGDFSGAPLNCRNQAIFSANAAWLLLFILTPVCLPDLGTIRIPYRPGPRPALRIYPQNLPLLGWSTCRRVRVRPDRDQPRRLSLVRKVARAKRLSWIQIRLLLQVVMKGHPRCY